MTTIHLALGKDGRLRSCEAKGHSGYADKGSDIVCAAISFLMRTVMQVLSETEGVQLESDTSLRGTVFFRIRQNRFDEKTNAELVFAGNLLKKGFSSLSKDYPENVLYEV